MITPTEQRETLLALYPIFKREVYDRRDRMMVWTAVGAGSLMLVLLTVLLAVPDRNIPTEVRLLLAAGTTILGATFALLIRQQHHRHRQAKQMLIKLEQTLGLFDDHAQNDPSLYPDYWQSDWTQDRSLSAYLTILAVLTGLVLTALFFPS